MSEISSAAAGLVATALGVGIGLIVLNAVLFLICRGLKPSTDRSAGVLLFQKPGTRRWSLGGLKHRAAVSR